MSWFRSTSSSRRAIAAALALCVGTAAAADRTEAARLTPAERQRVLRLSPLAAPPADPGNPVGDDDRAARLGQRLFFERRLSPRGVTCATCHDPARGFADGQPLSTGIVRGRRHTPTLWNVAFGRWYFWDGRADSLWSQALSPIESPTEMGGSRQAVADLVAADRALRRDYTAIFGEPTNDAEEIFANVGRALAAYERRLVSREAPLDRFVAALRRGASSAALSNSAVRGLKLFLGRGQCHVCHSGPNLSDGEFHNTGSLAPVGDQLADGGRYEGIVRLLASPHRRRDLPALLKQTPEMWGQFKTPTLRNVARTAPYMHDGRFATLREVLQFYSETAGKGPPTLQGERILRPAHFTGEEIDDLLALLEALTDESLPASLLHPPDDDEKLPGS